MFENLVNIVYVGLGFSAALRWNQLGTLQRARYMTGQ
jgi:hypothetical protein